MSLRRLGLYLDWNANKRNMQRHIHHTHKRSQFPHNGRPNRGDQRDWNHRRKADAETKPKSGPIRKRKRQKKQDFGERFAVIR